MKWLTRYISSSIGKKHIMALTGIALFGFLLTHLAGNFLYFLGPEIFNKYAHALTSSPLIYPAEMGLLVIFVVHIFFAFWTQLDNKSARKQAYAVPLTEEHNKLSSSFMLVTGVWLILFVVVHIVGIKFGSYIPYDLAGEEIRDLYQTVSTYFKTPGTVLFYVISMVILGIHLKHAFWSAHQTVGVSHRKYTPILKGLSLVIAFGLASGFILVVFVAALSKGAA